MAKYFHFSDEQIIELKAQYATTKNIDLANKFGCKIYTVHGKAYRLGLKKDKEFIAEMARIRALDPNYGSKKTCFKKGNKAFNKGLKQNEYMTPEAIEKTKHTRFAKGNMPHNHKPIGYEINRKGYMYVKTAEPKTFTAKQRMIWIENFGEIPKGYNVQFKDKNPLNFELSNLYLISRTNQVIENSIINYPTEVRQSFRLISKLKKSIIDHGKANIN